jgi:hypothetical protein
VSTPLRPLTLGELLDRTFTLYRTHFIVFAGIAGLPWLVVLAVQLLQVAVHPGQEVSLDVLGWLFGVLILSAIAATCSQAATVVAVSQLHLDRPITIGQAFAALRGRIGELCLITISVGFLIGLGIIACIVPGILLALRWAIVVPIAVLERAPLRVAMSRSADLTDGDRGRIFMIFLLYFILNIAMTFVWEAPIVVATVAATREAATPPVWTLVLAPIGGFFTQCLVGPLLTIAMSLVYYDARVRKEAFDIEHMMAQLDRSIPSPAAPA